MAKADIAVLLALGAAFFIAIGDVIHQRSALEVTDEPVGHLQLFTRLLRDGRWWLGTAVAAAGFGLQAAALAGMAQSNALLIEEMRELNDAVRSFGQQLLSAGQPQ